MLHTLVHNLSGIEPVVSVFVGFSFVGRSQLNATRDTVIEPVN
jgi:hypothetical protein